MSVHAFDILGDPVRRRILEVLAEGEHSSGEVVHVISEEFGITQSAVSQHLRVLRDSGFATVRSEGTRRVYALDAQPLRQIDTWLDTFRGFWTHRLEALATEVARGKREGAYGKRKGTHGKREAAHGKQKGAHDPRESNRKKAPRQTRLAASTPGKARRS